MGCNTKEEFLDTLGTMRENSNPIVIDAVEIAAKKGDWEFVKEILSYTLWEEYNTKLDWLYAKIPGQEV